MPKSKRRYIQTGVSYIQWRDLFRVPAPLGGFYLAQGKDVRRLLDGQLPRNGVHLRSVIHRCGWWVEQ